MPAMIRPNSKARKIAYSILGMPFDTSKKSRNSKTKKRLTYDDSYQMR